MQNELSFNLDLEFKDITFHSNVGTWHFVFADRMIVGTGGFWRLLKDGKILLVSSDHGHQFGLPKPIDLMVEIKKRFAPARLKEIVINKNTGDLTLKLTNHFKIEIYISSTGYETYDFVINNKRYIGMGSGDIAINEVH